MPFTDKDGYLIKAFQREKHDTESQFLKEFIKFYKQNALPDLPVFVLNFVPFWCCCTVVQRFRELFILQGNLN